MNNAFKWEHNETLYIKPRIKGRNMGIYSGVETKAVWGKPCLLELKFFLGNIRL